MKKTLLRAALAAAVTFAVTTASAALVNGTGLIADPPGVYMGSGIQNGNWTGVNTGGIEVALRAKDRGSYVNITPVGNLYQADPGLCNTSPTPCTGSNKADWNYEFSVSTIGAQTDLSQYFLELMVDTNPTASTAFASLNVFTNWTDNEYWDVDTNSKRKGPAPLLSGERVVQQSANPLFGNSGFGFLPTDGLYDIRMNVYGIGGENGTTGQRVLLASTDIQVKVGETVPVPEPASLALAGLGLVGLGLTRRRKVNKQA